MDACNALYIAILGRLTRFDEISFFFFLAFFTPYGLHLIFIFFCLNIPLHHDHSILKNIYPFLDRSVNIWRLAYKMISHIRLHADLILILKNVELL